MYHRLMNNPIESDILRSLQYGFRSKHSTFMAIFEVTNKKLEAFESNSLTFIQDAKCECLPRR